MKHDLRPCDPWFAVLVRLCDARERYRLNIPDYYGVRRVGIKHWGRP